MFQWRLTALVCFVLLAGCRPAGSCTAEVTAGSGTFKATTEGRLPKAELEQAALRFACDKFCAASPGGDTPACNSRCSVDATSGKIGLRSTCTEGTR